MQHLYVQQLRTAFTIFQICAGFTFTQLPVYF